MAGARFMRIRLLSPWNGNRAGAVIDPGHGVAELLVRRRIAEPVEEPSPKRVTRPPRNKAVARAERTKAGV